MKSKGIHIKIDDFMKLNNHCNVYYYDLEHRLIDVNENMMNLLRPYGYKTKMDLQNQVVIQEHKEFVVHKKENELVIESGHAMQFFNKINYKNSYLLLVTIKAPTYDDKGKINGVFGISQIISTSTIKETSPHHKISDRERQCIFHLVKGKTTTQIAESLGLSQRTVESYLDNIKNKLGCNSKSMLIDTILQMGLASFDKDSVSSEFTPGIFMSVDDKDMK